MLGVGLIASPALFLSDKMKHINFLCYELYRPRVVFSRPTYGAFNDALYYYFIIIIITYGAAIVVATSVCNKGIVHKRHYESLISGCRLTANCCRHFHIILTLCQFQIRFEFCRDK